MENLVTLEYTEPPRPITHLAAEPPQIPNVGEPQIPEKDKNGSGALK